MNVSPAFVIAAFERSNEALALNKKTVKKEKLYFGNRELRCLENKPFMPSKSTLQQLPKQVLLIMASIFLVFQSFGLLSGVDYYTDIGFWTAILLAWVINMFVTGIFAFAGFALPTHRLLPTRYYQVANPDQLKWFYQVFGVERFRKLLLVTLWRNKAQQQRYFNGRPDGLKHLEEQSQKAEFGHLLPFLILTVVSIYIIFFVQPVLGVLCLGINLMGNFYPVLLQRHHRMRLQRIAAIGTRARA